jgi:hypothetical protein
VANLLTFRAMLDAWPCFGRAGPGAECGPAVISEAEEHDAYQKALDRLLRDLRVERS